MIMDTTQVAAKSDIKILRTELNSDIKRLEAKIHAVEKRLNAKIDAVEKRLNAKIDAVEERLNAKIDAVEERLSTKLDKIMNILDGFVGVVDDLRTDNTVGTHQTRELQKKVDDHEERLQQVESLKQAV